MVGNFESTLAAMSDDEYTYLSCSICLIQTLLVYMSLKVALGHTDAGEPEGDHDEYEVRLRSAYPNATPKLISVARCRC